MPLGGFPGSFVIPRVPLNESKLRLHLPESTELSNRRIPKFEKSYVKSYEAAATLKFGGDYLGQNFFQAKSNLQIRREGPELVFFRELRLTTSQPSEFWIEKKKKSNDSFESIYHLKPHFNHVIIGINLWKQLFRDR